MARKPIPYQGSEPFVFVSYAHKDDRQVYPIISAMQEQGLRVWYDDAMDPGEHWGSVIAEHIEDCTAMLCMVTSSFFASRNCLNEIHYAYEEKKETMILYLEDANPPREFRLNYGRLHALHRTGYSDDLSFLAKVLTAAKLNPCIEKVDSVNRMQIVQEPTAEELYILGKKYYYGKGVYRSYEEAVKWYRKAADRGDARAQFMLGYCYDKGNGVPQSNEEAVKWYRKSADQGNAMAQNNLGVCYETGNGVPQSNEEAVKWYRKSADQGHAYGQFMLGACYTVGHGTPQSYNEAVKWYRKAAEQGNTDAQYMLGYCYAMGQGVPQSYEEAVKWYRKAAVQGNAVAMEYLAVCYENGYGIRKDKSQAKYWREKAAVAEK